MKKSLRNAVIFTGISCMAGALAFAATGSVPVAIALVVLFWVL